MVMIFCLQLKINMVYYYELLNISTFIVALLQSKRLSLRVNTYQINIIKYMMFKDNYLENLWSHFLLFIGPYFLPIVYILFQLYGSEY